MSAIKIIAIDIDATLLNSNHQLTNTVKNAIKSASEKGIKVVLTSGRPISGIRPFLKQLDLDDRNDQYVISFGGGVVETTSGRIISARSLSYEDYLDLQNIATKLGLHFHVESSERLFTSDRDLGKLNMRNSSINSVTGLPLREALPCIMKQIRKARTRAALCRF